MKIPKAELLPSGSWRVRVRVNGEDITVTRRTESEAVAEAMALKAGLKEAAARAPKDMTLREAIDEYIEMREAALSPSTIRGYVIIRDNRFPSVMDRTINKTTDKMYQQAVNDEVRRVSTKTVKNSWGFVSSVVNEIAGRKVSCVTPQVISKERLFLEPDEINEFVSAIEGHRDEIPMLLQLHGLRVSEVLDITWDDIDIERKMIHVRGSAVPDKDNNIVHKESNKTSASRRDVPILIPRLSVAVEEADKAKDYVYSNTPSALYNSINRVCRKNELPEIGNHGCRHSFASLCFHVGLPEQLTQRLGGWDDAGTLRKIYTHLASKDIRKHTAALESYFAPPQKKQKTAKRAK